MISDAAEPATHDGFEYRAEKFADLQVLRYRAPGFETLDLDAKKLIYFLYQACLSGRDIIWDQNWRFNLLARRTLEEIVRRYSGPRDDEDFLKFMTYVKRVWFSNGLHHHYSGAKLTPEVSYETFAGYMERCPGARWPIPEGWSFERFMDRLRQILFDPEYGAKKVNKDDGADKTRDSAVNYYEGVSEREAAEYYAALEDPSDPRPPSFGLNSKLVKQDGRIAERVWRVGGMYGPAIERMVFWLQKAAAVAPSPQRRVLEKLIEFYRTGDLRVFDDYSVAWVEDTASPVDMIHGFIEVYNDPLGFRGAFEAMVWVRDEEGTRRIAKIAEMAQWFEDHSPIEAAHRKTEVKGVVGSAINVIVEAGDASPYTAIGVNLPNADWIREEHGSKSVNLANIVTAYNAAAGPLVEEFAFSQEEIARDKQFGELADNLHTDLHEVIGHGSGRLETGVSPPAKTLKSYASTLEEARADLVALYYLMDPKLVELGLASSLETGRAAYDSYMRNGLMVQLRRLEPGENLEEDHMRNRQLIARWAYERGKAERVVERRLRDGKTYFTVNDYDKLRALFGELLREVQRVKSQGDYEAGKALVETYGVKVDQALLREVLSRVDTLGLAAFSGFVNPKLVPVGDPDDIRDVRIEYPESFTAQMLDYAEQYAFLPVHN